MHLCLPFFLGPHDSTVKAKKYVLLSLAVTEQASSEFAADRSQSLQVMWALRWGRCLRPGVLCENAVCIWPPEVCAVLVFHVNPGMLSFQ